MYRDTLIARLQENRRMSTDAEVQAFDNALNDLASLPLIDVMDALASVFLAFDDATEHSEVMWGLIPYIEAFDPETELRAFSEALPKLIGSAPRWVTIIVHRWINGEDSRSMFREVLPRLPIPSQTIIRQILEQIATESKDNRAKVESVIGN